MKKIIQMAAMVVVILMTALTAGAQKYMTRNGYIKFYSETPIETIQAENKQVNSALDLETGDLVFMVLMKSFLFEKALMQEHFNENYVESHKFPNSTLKAKVTNMSQIDFTKPGTYEALIEGDLTLHGVTQKISEKGTFTVKDDGSVQGISKFYVKPKDYDIKIPGAVVKNIAETIEVTVDVMLTKL
ncbi:MAG: YceI family protein [Bacteroidales bacterium]|jgi:hypothetical protein